MKNFISLILFLILVSSYQGYSQVVLEEGFENVSCEFTNPFFEGCIPSWTSSHGSPSLNTGNLPPFEGTNYTYMYSEFDGDCDEKHRGEGIVLNFNFQAGVTYQISYAIRGDNTPPPNVTYQRNWVLTNGLPNNTGSDGCIYTGEIVPNTPPGSVFLPTPSYNNDNWTFNEQSFTPETDFSQLWFRAWTHHSTLSAETSAFIQIDDFTLEVLCDPNDGGVEFHFEHEDGTPDDIFTLCEDVFVDASLTNPMNGFYHMSLATVDANGNITGQLAQTDDWWTPGDLNNPINVNTTFNDITFQTGLIYRIKLDVYNENCKMWMSNTRTFQFTDMMFCDERIDLTACAFEDDYGYICLECSSGVSYDWDFPFGSTAFSLEGDGSSCVLNAGEGTYSVTITDDNGCTEEREYEIVADCCNSCDPPVDLTCKNVNHGTLAKLVWADVPDNNGYEITIVTNNSTACGCPVGVQNSTTVINPAGVNYLYYPVNGSSCFSWSVRTKCTNGLTSEDSTPMCFSYFSGCYETQMIIGDGDSNHNSNLSPRIHPNPSSGVLNFELNAPDDLTLTVELYSLDGKLVKSFAKETHPDGNYQKNWTIDDQLTDGIYFVFFRTNFGTFQKKVVISRGDIQRK